MLKSPLMTSEIWAKQKKMYTGPSVFAFRKSWEGASLESSDSRYEYQNLSTPRPENA